MRLRLGLALLVSLAFALPAVAAGERTSINIDGYPHLGPADAPVTVIEFLDFQ